MLRSQLVINTLYQGSAMQACRYERQSCCRARLQGVHGRSVRRSEQLEGAVERVLPDE